MDEINPLEHVIDQKLFGLDQSGQFHWIFALDHEVYNEKLHEFMEIGPMKLFGFIDLVFTKHMAGITVVALFLFLVGMLVARAARRSVKRAEGPKGRIQNFVEAVFAYLRDEMIIPAVGPHGAKYVPLFVTYFFLVLFCNLFGMIPVVGTPTGNIAVTGALASTVLVLIFALGIREQGTVGFFRNVVPRGVPIAIWPLMFFIEMLGVVVKCIALMIRLFANMLAGHTVIVTFLMLIGIMGTFLVAFAAVPIAVAMSLLEILVAFIQAYIFALLATIFIGMAVHPEH